MRMQGLPAYTVAHGAKPLVAQLLWRASHPAVAQPPRLSLLAGQQQQTLEHRTGIAATLTDTSVLSKTYQFAGSTPALCHMA
jgi:hypothetical protein